MIILKMYQHSKGSVFKTAWFIVALSLLLYFCVLALPAAVDKNLFKVIKITSESAFIIISGGMMSLNGS